MVLIETITLYAFDQSASTNAIATHTHTDHAGVLNRSLTDARSRAPGGPPSRAKANSMREFDVTDDSPQNHIAPITIHRSTSASRPPIDVVSTYTNALDEVAA